MNSKQLAQRNKKLSDAIKGRKWYNNSINRVQCIPGTQPEGYVCGKELGINEDELLQNIPIFIATHTPCRLSDISTQFGISISLARRLTKECSCWDLLCHDNNQEQNRKTKLERYGDENYNNVTSIVNTQIERYGGCGMASETLRAKQQSTMIDKYGVQHNWSGNDDINGMNTRIKLYGGSKQSLYEHIISKGKETKLDKYGDEWYSNHEQASDTMNRLYGQKYYVVTSHCRNTLNTEGTKNKRYATMRSNRSFNTSKPEESTYQYLCHKYGEDDVVRQYKSEVYPFNCDFYISSIDTYIECNYHWTHGPYPYENNEQSNKLLEYWRSKPQEHLNKQGKIQPSAYAIAIKVWTDLDVKKLKIAQLHNLKYICLYNGDTINAYL